MRAAARDRGNRPIYFRQGDGDSRRGIESSSDRFFYLLEKTRSNRNAKSVGNAASLVPDVRGHENAGAPE